MNYSLFRAATNSGPWQVLFTIPLAKGVDYGPFGTSSTFCYRVEALDVSGHIIRNYNAVCVPEHVVARIASANITLGPLHSSISSTVRSAQGQVQQLTTTPPPYNAMCLSDAAFTGQAITLGQIRTFLSDRTVS